MSGSKSLSVCHQHTDRQNPFVSRIEQFATVVFFLDITHTGATCRVRHLSIGPSLSPSRVSSRLLTPDSTENQRASRNGKTLNAHPESLIDALPVLLSFFSVEIFVIHDWGLSSTSDSDAQKFPNKMTWISLSRSSPTHSLYDLHVQLPPSPASTSKKIST